MLTAHQTPRLIPLGGALLLLATLAACNDRQLPTAPGQRPATVFAPAGVVVNSTLDDGDGTCLTKCTLRDAIATASTGATITFADTVTGTITLTQGQLTISKSLTINGPGAASLAVSANSASRVLRDTASAVIISGLTIRNGNAGSANGGGIFNDAGSTLVLKHSVVSGSYGAGGGGIYNHLAALTVDSSTISGNSTLYSGGGIFNDQQGLEGGPLIITHSTISGNTSSNEGGGVSSVTWLADTTHAATILNSTISGNKALTGGGLRNVGGLMRIEHSTVVSNQADRSGAGVRSWNDESTRTQVKGSIIWGNSITYSTTRDDVSADEATQPYQSLGYNLIGEAGANVSFTTSFNLTSDQTAVADAKLGPLNSNGGPTKTHALLAGSPALDKGICTDYNGETVADDQRGVARPQGDYCDVGAFEFEVAGKLTPTFTFDLSTLPAKTYGDTSFSVASYATTNSTGTITFAKGTAGVGCTVEGTGTVIITGAAVDPSACIVVATLAPDATYNGATATKSFNIAKAALTVTAANKTITFGNPTPTFSVDYSGFVGTDNASSLGGTLVYTFQGTGTTSYGPSTTAPTNAGTYSITPSGLSSSNYSFTYATGTLTINKAANLVSITNIPTSATVNNFFTPTYSYAGDGTPSAISKTTSTCTVGGGVVSFVAEGTCTLQASVTEGTNYLAATGTDQSFTIGPTGPVFSNACTYTVNTKNSQRSVTVTWQNASPGVTLVQVTSGGRTNQRQLAPTASGSWSTKLQSGTPVYNLKGGAKRGDVSTELTTAGACTQQ
ncbi:MAG TPA: choice-of-anchor Q domain-containing protein [Gemmatimonadaceae bacterium]|nr:choice-of-anchor Q domain-containing protein [Gemmatimonadaceae bacterium]